MKHDVGKNHIVPVFYIVTSMYKEMHNEIQKKILKSIDKSIKKATDNILMDIKKYLGYIV